MVNKALVLRQSRKKTKGSLRCGADGGMNMDKHPAENIMDTTLAHLKEMIDVETVVGKPVFSDNGTVIIPLSRVGFGFVAGGSQFGEALPEAELPFGGGAGAGMSVSPCGFLVIINGTPSFLPAQSNESIDKVLNSIPEIINKVKDAYCACSDCGGDCEAEDN